MLKCNIVPGLYTLSFNYRRLMDDRLISMCFRIVIIRVYEKLNLFVTYLLFCREPLPNIGRTVIVTIDVQHPDLLSVNPPNFNITADNLQKEWIVSVKGLSAGHSIVSANVTPSDITE